jgi:DNA-directed RNA polymerase specialized sigma24 family protein
MVIGKKKIKKRPGTTNEYFTESTQTSIKYFQDNESSRKRDKLLELEILPALTKMAEYWVYVYGLESPTQSKEELVQSCVGFLYDSIHKWDSERATKAFSYFNVVARNWLINAVNSHKKKSMRDLSIDNVDLELVIHGKDANQNLIAHSAEVDIINIEMIKDIRTRISKIKNGLDDERDLSVMEAIEKVFDSSESLDFMTRSALFIYIRELCGYDKRTISRSMSKIRKVYKNVCETEKKNEKLKEDRLISRYRQ